MTEMIKVVTSGTALGERGWDAGITDRDDNNPIDVEIDQAIKKARGVKKGKGMSYTFYLTPDAARYFVEDWALEAYQKAHPEAHGYDPDCRTGGLAMLRTVNMIKKQLGLK